ncbi:MAG: pseudouridine-5'-phosphate glycosidase [Anaerolineales bacterium]|jgi:pseudouridine-5'-phosphate glycosidase|nr:pseudouridine-5'-phosphate glycosidase [Anaerolineales bacterium]
MTNYPDLPSIQLWVHEEVSQALQARKPVVALESTVITHGLPFPQNLELARNMEQEVRAQGAIPATIGVVDGRVCVGLQADQLEGLAQARRVRKISSRDFAPAVVQGASGGTTVAGTLIAAHLAGIRVFATGGIGGVHRQAPFDVSTDLMQLSRTPVLVVCAGAKAILDLPATLETLETLGVPVLGYQTNDFPAFYSRSSGLAVSARANSPAEAAAVARAHWALGLASAILVTQPPPEADALPAEQIESVIVQALKEAHEQSIYGQAVSPFLLRRVSELSGGASLKANLALLLNNARLAGQIACFM